MTARPSLGPGSGTIPGPTFFAEYQPAIKGLFDASALPLTSVGGTASAVTATCAWDLDAGTLVDGMKFTLTWAAESTGPMTLALNGGSPVNVLDASGGAMIAGSAAAGTRTLLEYVGGAFRVLSGASAGSSAEQNYYWSYTASGTWTKPAGLSDSNVVWVELWGGGGAGGGQPSDGGGGGGAHAIQSFRLSDLPSVVAVAIGAGGTSEGNGGNTTFGALLTAFGGGGCNSDIPGGGGGSNQAGAPLGVGGWLGGGTGAAPDATTESGGGGGGSGGTSPTAGGRSVKGGGGGGGGAGSAAGGVSLFGGNGGSVGNAGSAPGGGGGRNAAGARGQARIWM